jgi:hypothetical protein
MEDNDHLPSPFQHTERSLDSMCRHVRRDVLELTCR